MRKRSTARGFTIVEIIIASVIFVMVVGMALNATRFLQKTLSHQMRLDRMSQALDVTQEISREVRSARRILSVSPSHLDLEVYDFSMFDTLDPLLYANTRRLRYEYREDDRGPRLVRELFESPASSAPVRSSAFLAKVGLIAPTEAEPFFFASYLVRHSTVGVRLALALHPPYSEDHWVPAKNEVYVKAE